MGVSNDHELPVFTPSNYNHIKLEDANVPDSVLLVFRRPNLFPFVHHEMSRHGGEI